MYLICEAKIFIYNGFCQSNRRDLSIQFVPIPKSDVRCESDSAGTWPVHVSRGCGHMSCIVQRHMSRGVTQLCSHGSMCRLRHGSWAPASLSPAARQLGVWSPITSGSLLPLTTTIASFEYEWARAPRMKEGNFMNAGRDRGGRAISGRRGRGGRYAFKWTRPSAGRGGLALRTLHSLVSYQYSRTVALPPLFLHVFATFDTRKNWTWSGFLQRWLFLRGCPHNHRDQRLWWWALMFIKTIICRMTS